MRRGNKHTKSRRGSLSSLVWKERQSKQSRMGEEIMNAQTLIEKSLFATKF
jgi:hypothetical protein